ncbi:hypothetical protein GCM10010412_011000 [Nonomuraea recticatena]|uniref:Protein kinase domain-containing protein n=2 Tax=Nonomuraea recticatena TaxID=46178 RepID=A0ABP6DMX1_9ACTN
MRRVPPLRSTDPRQVAGFTLRGRLGQGGQGTVFLGVSPTGEHVAVKLLHAAFGQDTEARRYFDRELAALRRVAPFCTARVLAAEPDADPPYVISEYIDGPSVQDAVRDRGVMAGAELTRLAIATATALGAIHAAGVVHRDFKPANVLLAADGPRVIDFGIARPLDATAATVSGVVGTPAYMSPEQLAGDPAGPSLDLFAWACTIVYAAAGRPPFGHEPLPAVINRILNAPPDLGPLTGTLRALVAACLEKDPSRRPTAQQVLLGLMDERPGAPIPPLPGPVDPRPPAARSWSPAPPPPGPPSWQNAAPPSWQTSKPPVGPPSTQPSRMKGRAVAGAALTAGLAVLTVLAVVIANGMRQPDTTSGPTPSPSTATSQGTPAGQLARSPRLGLEFWQDGAPSLLTLTDLERPVTTVAMKRAPFELRFPTLPKDTPLQICAWTDASVFSVTDGGRTDDHPCFAPGTGIADYEHGSGTLYLNNAGHNHLVGSRVAAHSSTQDKVLFASLFQGGAASPVAQRQGELYLTVFVDLDGDGAFKRAGEGEYEYLVLDFPS